VIIDFVRFLKLINRLLSSNIDFIDLSISFPIIDFDRFVTPCFRSEKRVYRYSLGGIDINS